MLSLFTLDILVIIYKLSRLVVPEFAYNKAVLKSIKQDDKPPNKKYIRPPEVADSESLYIVDNKYKP
jgi:hypothetical protein